MEGTKTAPVKVDWDKVSKELKRPSDNIKITLEKDKVEQNIFMSSGLLRQLATLCGGAEELAGVFADAALQQDLISVAMAPRDEKGEFIEEEYKAYADLISIEEGDKLVTWISQHCMHFFLKSIANTGKLMNPTDLGAETQKAVDSMLSTNGTSVSAT